MIIRKKFKFEASHMVRNCSTERCQFSIHGHSFVVEVMVTARALDRGQMVMDFSLFKPYVADFIDSFDHTYMIWDKELPEFIDKIKSLSERWVILPMSPSAEGLAIMFYRVIMSILHCMKFNNDEDGVQIHAVRVHETETGYAEFSTNSTLKTPFFNIGDIIFSQDIVKDWKVKNWWDKTIKFEKYD